MKNDESDNSKEFRAPKRQKQRESVLDIRDATDDFEDPRQLGSTPSASAGRRRKDPTRGPPPINSPIRNLDPAILKAEKGAVRTKPLVPNPSPILDKAGKDGCKDEGSEGVTAYRRHRVTNLKASREERINRLICKFLAKNHNTAQEDKGEGVTAQRRRPHTRPKTTKNKMRQFVAVLSNAKKALMMRTSQHLITSFVLIQNEDKEARREIHNAMRRALKAAMRLPWEVVRVLTSRLLKRKHRTNMVSAGPDREAGGEAAEGDGDGCEAGLSITKTRATATPPPTTTKTKITKTIAPIGGMGAKLLQSIAEYKEESENKRFYRQNTDLKNWKWSDQIKKRSWEKMKTRKSDRADCDWPGFVKKWYGRTEYPLDDDPTLSLEHLPASIVGKVTSIFVRDVYRTLFDYVWIKALECHGLDGCIITGQPGTGKSLFQIYLLVRLLQMKQPVLFSPNGTEFYLFFGDSVYFTERPPSSGMLPKPKSESDDGVFLWSLFDIYKNEGPTGSLYTYPCFPVQTTSLNEERYRRWSKHLSPLCLGMPLWTEGELREALPYQRWYPRLLETLSANPDDPLKCFPGARDAIDGYMCAINTGKQENALLLNDREQEDAMPGEDHMAIGMKGQEVKATLDTLLQAAIAKFGNAARDVFGGMVDFEGMTSRHENITYNQLRTITGLYTAANRTMSQVFALSPFYSTDGIFRPVGWEMSFKSEWVAQNTMDKIVHFETKELCLGYQHFMGTRVMSLLAGLFFKGFAHRVIMTTISETTPWPLIRMHSDNNTQSPLFTVPNRASTDVHVALPSVKRRYVPLHSLAYFHDPFKNNTYYVPRRRDNPLFDSFTVEIGDSSAVLWVFQITTPPKHGGSAEGYRHVRYIVERLKAQLRERGHPSKAEKRCGKQAARDVDVQVRYVLVVPACRFEEHQWRFPKGWNGAAIVDGRRGGVYCMKIDAYEHYLMYTGRGTNANLSQGWS